MRPKKERYPPRLVGKLMLLTLDFESWRPDIRSYIEEYQNRYAQCGAKQAKLWAYKQAAKGLWDYIPSEIRGGLVAVAIKLLLRN